MRILLITHLVPYPPKDGPSLRNFNLLKECAENNEITLLTFFQKIHGYDKNYMKNNISELKKYCKHVEVFEIPCDGKHFRWILLLLFNLFSSKPYSFWWYWSRKMKNAIVNQISNNNFDLVELGEIGLLFYSKYAPEIPKLLVHHNVESQLLNRRSKVIKNPLAKLYLRIQAYKLKRCEYKACNEIEYHTTVSEQDKITLLNINSNAKVQVVPNGVDIDYFLPNSPKVKSNSLVFIGTMTWYPNLDAMRFFKDEIWPLIKKSVPDITINVIGKNPPDDFLKFSQKDGSFNFLGFVDDVRPYISESAIYVVPLRFGGGSRLKILDALAMGKAIISTKVGAEGINVTNDKDIIIADKPEEFANQIISLLKDTKKLNRMETNARKLAVEQYSWKSIAPKLEWVYQTLGEN